jgi:hypothetical protein
MKALPLTTVILFVKTEVACAIEYSLVCGSFFNFPTHQQATKPLTMKFSLVLCVLLAIAVSTTQGAVSEAGGKPAQPPKPAQQMRKNSAPATGEHPEHSHEKSHREHEHKHKHENEHKHEHEHEHKHEHSAPAPHSH